MRAFRIIILRCAFLCLSAGMVPVLLLACGSLPVIHSSTPGSTEEAVRRCRHPFLEVPYRFVHAIEARVAGRPPGTVLGITVIDPPAQTVHCVMLTLEGFVLFEARYDNGVQVMRAVPPFDSIHFGRNMMEDVRLTFLVPEGRLAAADLDEGGSAVCRYDGRSGKTTDVVVHADNTWEIKTYDEHHQPLRSVVASLLKDGVPELLDLTGSSMVNYTLHLRLLSAEPATLETRESPLTDGE
jgi:hypothetical protein